MTAATISTGRGTRIAYVSESTWGTTPSTPTLKQLRAVTSTLRGTVTKATSQEFTTDRNVRGEFMTGKGAEGRIEGELIYGIWDDFMAAALASSWSTNVLKVGSFAQFFSIEETYELGVLDQYHRYLGCAIDGMDMTFEPNDTARIGFDIISRELTVAAAAISGSSYTAPNAYAMPATTAGITGVTWGGISATPIVRSVRINVRNNWMRRPVWNDARSTRFGIGMQDVTGEVVCYFDDYQIYQEIYTQSTASLAFTYGVTTAQKYTITIPQISWGDGAVSSRTRDTDLTVTMPFRAIYNTSAATALTITRAVA